MMFHINRQTAKVNDAGVVNSSLRKEHAAATLSRTRGIARHGATAEERLRQGLGISNRGDFIETDEYLQRLGLVIVRGGSSLIPEGRRYLTTSSDLTHRISRQR